MRRTWTFIWKIFTQGCFVTSLVKNGSVVLEKKIFNSFQCTFTISQLSPLWEGCGPSLNKLHPRMLCAKFGWSWTSDSGEEDFLKFVTVFLLFHNYHPFEKGVTLHFNKLESPLPKHALCKVWLILAQWFWRRRFLKVVNFFYYFPIISPLGRACLFIWTNLNPLHPGILCAKFRWNWPNCIFTIS